MATDIMPIAVHSFVKYWLPPLLWAAVIFGLSSLPASDEPGVEIPYLDKVAHAFVFAILALLIYRALRSGHGCSLAWATAMAFGLTSLYGLSDEFHQSFVPTRHVEVMDWVADTVGAGIAMLFISISNLKGRGSKERR